MRYKQNIDSIQILRAVAALLVVIWHSRLAIKYCTNSYWIEADANILANIYPSVLNHLYFGVDIFFCISGFIMAMLIEKMTPTVSSTIKFLTDRVARIFPPYWVFTGFVVLVFILSKGSYNVGHLENSLSADVPRVMTSLVLLPQSLPPILGVGWTLIHEQMFYLLCGLLVMFGLNERSALVLGVLSVLSFMLFVTKTSILHGYVLSIFNFEFFCGALAFSYYNKLKSWSLLSKLSPLVILAALFCYWIASELIDGQYFEPNLVRVILGGVIGFLLIIGLGAAGAEYRIANTRLGQLLMRIGDASYVLYLVHWFVLSGMGKIIGHFSPGASIIVVAFWHALSLTVSIGMALIVSERVEMPVHRYLRNTVKRKFFFSRMESVSSG